MSDQNFERCLHQANLCRTWGVASHALIAAIEPDASIINEKFDPFTFIVKDAISIENRPVSFGLRPPLIAHSDESATLVRRLQDRGGVLLGIANLDEAALGALGTNRYYGDVSNPRDPNFIAGGSSSGCAAAVAAGCADIGIGTDWGGSVRIPAACCNVWGFKFSSQAVSRDGVILYHEIHDSIGFIFDDVERGIKGWSSVVKNTTAMAGSLAPQVNFLSPKAVAELGAEDSQLYEEALNLLARDLTLADAVDWVPFEEARRIRRSSAPECLRSLLGVFPINSEILPEQARALLALANRQEAKDLENETNRLIESWPVDSCLVTPCFPLPYPIRKDSDNKVEAAASCTYYMELANVLDCPAVVLPKSIYGFALQIIGPRGGDEIIWSTLRRLRNPSPKAR